MSKEIRKNFCLSKSLKEKRFRILRSGYQIKDLDLFQNVSDLKQCSSLERNFHCMYKIVDVRWGIQCWAVFSELPSTREQVMGHFADLKLQVAWSSQKEGMEKWTGCIQGRQNSSWLGKEQSAHRGAGLSLVVIHRRGGGGRSPLKVFGRGYN